MADVGNHINPAPISEASPRSCGCGRMYRIVVVLALAFSAPIVITYWHSPDRPVPRGENLQSLPPSGNVDRVPGRDPDAALHRMLGAWNLVLLSGGECGEACRESLQTLSRVNAAQGRYARRVDSVWLIARDSNAGPFPESLVGGSRITVLAVDVPSISVLHRRLDPGVAHVPGTLYVLDPLGKLVRRYAPKVAPEGVLDDLARLVAGANS
jgi:hypothetical protein